jgi:hypothetical protein
MSKGLVVYWIRIPQPSDAPFWGERWALYPTAEKLSPISVPNQDLDMILYLL